MLRNSIRKYGVSDAVKSSKLTSLDYQQQTGEHSSVLPLMARNPEDPYE
uniref:Uncharacterized protein n=1 Tax=Pseudomonas aeruginosa TaxID=287 RepID=A0A2L1KEI6_PSEAI|nr:Hypothetical protein [Pseudomonas aeruginosa]QLG05181.1 hypothetical protein [Pseudomonas aeruginosa]